MCKGGKFSHFKLTICQLVPRSEPRHYILSSSFYHINRCFGSTKLENGLKRKNKTATYQKLNNSDKNFSRVTLINFLGFCHKVPPFLYVISKYLTYVQWNRNSYPHWRLISLSFCRGNFTKGRKRVDFRPEEIRTSRIINGPRFL